MPDHDPNHRRPAGPRLPEYGPQPPPANREPPEPPPEPPERADSRPAAEVVLVGHSPLVFWWPVWVVGYVMALLTWLDGRAYDVGSSTVKLHPDGRLGVLFFLTLFLVIVLSTVSVRRPAAVAALAVVVLAVAGLAAAGAWGPVLGWVGDLNVYLNQGAYFWFSTLMALVWAVTVFAVDPLTRWRVRPGRLSREVALGAASGTYDTGDMVFEKRRDDVLRHWVLGLGSGDLWVRTRGGRSGEVVVPNVLFIGSKVEAIRRLTAAEPARIGHAVPE